MKKTLKPMICLSTLATEPKHAVWNAIKRDAPALADVLASAFIREITEECSGSIEVAIADLPESAMQVLKTTRRTSCD